MNGEAVKKLLVAFLLAVTIAAQPAMAVEKLELGFGLGVAPDYEGSEDYVPVLLPYARVDLDLGQFLRLHANRLRGIDFKANLIPDDIWRFGPMLGYIPERDSVHNNQVDRMRKVDTSVMVGIFWGIEIDGWTAEIEAQQDAVGGNGSLFTLKAGYKMPISSQVMVEFSLFTAYADGDYMNAYFSVDRGDSKRSGLDRYDADSGFKDVGFWLTGRYNFYGYWNVLAVGNYSRLIGDAADSPIVDDQGDPNQFLLGLMLSYDF
jgi:outer membrane protein